MWSPSSDNIGIKEYKLFKDGIYIASTPSTTYKVTGLNDNTEYTFSVIAQDTSDNLSEPNNLSVRTSSHYKFIYDANGRLISIVFISSGKVIKSFEYDRNGNLVRVNEHP